MWLLPPPPPPPPPLLPQLANTTVALRLWTGMLTLTENDNNNDNATALTQTVNDATRSTDVNEEAIDVDNGQ